MLADDLGKPEKTREYARKVSHEAEQLGRVVGNVLGYSRLERGHLPIHTQRGDLAHSVHDSVERLRPSIEASGARLDLSAGGDLPAVAFDADAVHHIVQNLVDNAAKFSREAEDRTIHVRLAAERQEGRRPRGRRPRTRDLGSWRGAACFVRSLVASRM